MDKGTIIRSAVLLIALANQFLISAGLNPIPGSEAVWGEILASAFTVVAAGIAWFKNNYITIYGKQQKKVLEAKGLIKR